MTAPTRPHRGRSRSLATGKFLGIGHIGLFAMALLIAISEVSWGRSALHWAYHQSIASDVAGWGNNPVIRDAASWSNGLPWGAANWPYLVLGVACLVVRFYRRVPGPLSLIIALPAAIYGALVAVAALPFIAFEWTLAVPALIISWIIVAKTLR